MSSNVYKYLTQYVIDDKLYCSEVFVPGDLTVLDVIRMRCMPEEEVVDDGKIVVQNLEHSPKYDLHKESISYYISEGKYLDAAHRTLYLMMAAADGVDTFDLVKDDGLLHELIHGQSVYSQPDQSRLTEMANGFEVTVPGTFLWALSQVKS